MKDELSDIVVKNLPKNHTSEPGRQRKRPESGLRLQQRQVPDQVRGLPHPRRLLHHQNKLIKKELQKGGKPQKVEIDPKMRKSSQRWILVDESDQFAIFGNKDSFGASENPQKGKKLEIEQSEISLSQFSKPPEKSKFSTDGGKNQEIQPSNKPKGYRRSLFNPNRRFQSGQTPFSIKVKNRGIHSSQRRVVLKRNDSRGAQKQNNSSGK